MLLSHILLPLAILGQQVLSAPVDIPSKQYVVDDLPGIDAIDEADRPIMYAGHITLDKNTNTNYFFWKFIKPDTDFNRTIFWLNGGPGCSSMDGALMESGPLRVNSDGNLYINEGSWYETGDMVFVDQPGGTGFSTTMKYDKELTTVATDFVVFLKNYFAVFPEDADKEIYIAGESYAGQYIPFIADAIFTAVDKGELDVELKGLLIGNGWIDPNVQSMSYIPYLLDAGIIHQSDEFFSKLLKEQEKCQNEVNDGSGNDKFSLVDCENILNRILSYTRDKTAPKMEQCINMYDTRLRDSYPSCGMNWPPDLPLVEPWLQREATVKALNLDPDHVTKWRECDGEVSKYLQNKHSKPSINLLPGLLQRVNIMLFNGNKDIICNNYGVLDLISKMTWGGSTGFDEAAEELQWVYGDGSTGTVKSSKNLTFVDVWDSSHMVPFDKPAESRGLFDIFVGNIRFGDNDNGTYVETPVYKDGKFVWITPDTSKATTPSASASAETASATSSTGVDGTDNTTDSSDNDDSDEGIAGSGKSATPFILYLVVIGIVGGLLLYFQKDKSPKKNSILKTHARKATTKPKKNVSWADESTETDQRGAVGEFFNNYKTNKKGYKSVGGEEGFEDIELQPQQRADDEDVDFDLDEELHDDEENQLAHTK